MMFRNETRFWTVLAALGLASVAIECGGPEAFRSRSATGGNGGSQIAGAAGAVGAAGVGSPGVAGTMGTAGDTPPLAGMAGDSGAGTAGATGMAGTGAAGTNAAGATGTAGAAGAAGAGTAGTNATGTAGATGMAGATGTAGTGTAGTMGTAGAAGTAGAGGAGGAAGTGAAGAGGAPPPAGMFKVQYECRQNGANALTAEYSIKVVNTGTTDIALSNVTVRYWYTIDGTGAQAGTCASAAHPCTIAFQSTAAKPTADQYGVISFASGTLAKGTDTGEVQILIHGTGTYNQMNDYSFDNTGAVFTDEMHITGYLGGKLVWGTAP